MMHEPVLDSTGGCGRGEGGRVRGMGGGGEGEGGDVRTSLDSTGGCGRGEGGRGKMIMLHTPVWTALRSPPPGYCTTWSELRRSARTCTAENREPVE